MGEIWGLDKYVSFWIFINLVSNYLCASCMPGTLQSQQTTTVNKTAQISTLVESTSWWVEIDNKLAKTECEVVRCAKRRGEQGRGAEISEAWGTTLNVQVKLILIVKESFGQRFEGGRAGSLPALWGKGSLVLSLVPSPTDRKQGLCHGPLISPVTKWLPWVNSDGPREADLK